MKFRIPTLDILVLGAIAACGIMGLALLYWLLGGPSIVITNNPDDALSDRPVSALSGLPCENARRRPVAVMLASDEEARPLAGIGQADMVFEMPVTPNGITRMMAVYQCNNPEEIGSIRSARQDFLPLAQGVDAILVHWGGERDTLAALDRGVMDNVDALKYEGTTFYRKDEIARPHNGFTTLALVGKRSESLGYRSTTSLDPYTRASTAGERNLGSISDEMNVPWPQGLDVTFTYDGTSNTYLRKRGGKPEMDASTDSQVRASVVVLLQTESSFLYDQYIRVNTVGTGTATIWQNGQRINSLWKKEDASAMLRFTDGEGKDIPLQQGTVWVLIDTPLPTP